MSRWRGDGLLHGDDEEAGEGFRSWRGSSGLSANIAPHTVAQADAAPYSGAMASMSFEVFDALRSAGVAEEKARAAAEAMAKGQPDLSDVRADIRVLQFRMSLLTGVLVVIGLPALWLLWRVAAKVGALPV